MRKRNIFSNVRSLTPARSMFDLSYEKKFTCDMGELIPILCDEAIPGDVWKIANEAVIRFQPLVAPILHEINMYVHYYFVPYRLLWPLKYEDEGQMVLEDGSWEGFITSGDKGDNVDVLPAWTPTNTAVGSLWDYLGFPTGVVPNAELPVLDFPRRAYNLVFNSYYRDEVLQDEVAYDQETILLRNWEKDYFTSALLSQQKGTAPALPISGTTHAVWPPVGGTTDFALYGRQSTHVPRDADTLATLNNNTVDLGVASTFDVSDLRLAFQIQKWMERNSRAGTRYTEFLRSHFGVSPRDDRLNRPEYIGGSKAPVIISEVLQTSKTEVGAPQGNLAGHGLTVGQGFAGSYRVQEYGLIIGILSVMPRSLYQQGINRQWLRRTKYDFYFPEFANLSEQMIETGELYTTAAAGNLVPFGYQGRYDEMRTKNSMVCGDMRATFDYWHISRQFVAAPTLNDTFIMCNPRKDCFAAPSVDGLIVSFANLIHAFRPLPAQAEPGLIDHS